MNVLAHIYVLAGLAWLLHVAAGLWLHRNHDHQPNRQNEA